MKENKWIIILVILVTVLISFLFYKEYENRVKRENKIKCDNFLYSLEKDFKEAEFKRNRDFIKNKLKNN